MKITSRNKKRIIMTFGDLILIPMAMWLSFSLRLGELYVPEADIPYLFLLAPILSVPIFIRFGLYNAIIRYIGFHALWAVIQAVTLYALVWGLVALLSGAEGLFPRSVVVINWFVALLLIGGSRMMARWWLSGVNPIKRIRLDERLGARKNVVIYGAGSAGVQLASALSFSSEYKPIAFFDDDPHLKNNRINGFRVYPFYQLGHLIEKFNVSEVLLALPSIERGQRNKIISKLEPYPVHVRILPGIAELAQGKIKIDDIREVEIEDLLGRDSVQPDSKLLELNIRDKTVLVTGAGGSIGSELCRQIINLSPNSIILYEHSEFALYSIENELRKIIKNNADIENKERIELMPILGSVCDQNRLEQVCNECGVQTIYHAAAYKHVPMVEKNPAEAIRNNIFGTLKTANAAINSGVETFVLISTDKAVRPTNTMGASKRFAELILQGLANKSNSTTRFCMVRFGNVLGSSGSVVPLFREQIKAGGPITVTDPKIIRYFMTIPEAAQLVIQAGAMGQGGDVFVLDMGEPVNILSLAKTLIRLSGLEVRDSDHINGDIEIQFTGLRPGEKLYEELLIGDNVASTQHPLVMRAEEEVLPWSEVEKILTGFSKALEKPDQELIRELLLGAVKGYNPQCGIEDLLYKRQNSQIKEKNILDFCVKKLS